ncbi:CDP-alcohol phosphatidyltransferase family protein [Leptolyngbya sp. AN03gr2]|uniref:CDP-alcohol phosphatidyltransferase family protein n=1 Tax=unclassified Leptolyngbya TaxID=2650499 RepID=UPI003D31734E
MIKLAYIPAILVGFRFAIAPLLLLDALDGTTTNWFLWGYILAIVSDIFDGIIARRLGVSTPQLRQADSWADICLFLCLALSTWLVYPTVILDFKIPLLIAVAAQLFLFSISLIKFGKLPSFHTYTAKAWGLALLVAAIALFGFGYVPTLWSAIVLCWINSLEEIVMTLILPVWACDVLSVFHAAKLRDNY